jgi:hypothetical protein
MSNKFIPFSEKEINNVSVYQLKQLLRDNNLKIPDNKRKMYLKLKINGIPIVPEMDSSDSLCASAYPYSSDYTKEEILFLVEEKLNMDTRGMSKIDGCRALHNANIFPENILAENILSETVDPLRYYRIPKSLPQDYLSNIIVPKPELLEPVVKPQSPPVVKPQSPPNEIKNPFIGTPPSRYSLLPPPLSPLSPRPLSRPLSPILLSRPLSPRPLSPRLLSRPLSPRLLSRPLSPRLLSRPLSPRPNYIWDLYYKSIKQEGKKCRRSKVGKNFLMRDKKGRFCKKSKKSKK